MQLEAQKHSELGPLAGWGGLNLQRELWRNPARVHSSGRRGGEPGRAGAQAPARGIGREVELEGFDRRLTGVADVVVKNEAGGIEIRDFKSGRVLGDTGELSDTYRRQLLLYAAVYRDQFGDWPTRLVIDPLTQPSIEIDPDPSEALDVVEETFKEVDGFNEAVQEGNLEALARPSRSACGFCPHLQRCEPFWKRSDHSWEGRPPAAAGRVDSVGAGWIDLRVTGGTIAPGLLRVGGTAEHDLIEEQVLRVTRFERRGTDKVVLGDDAELRRVPPGEEVVVIQTDRSP